MSIAEAVIGLAILACIVICFTACITVIGCLVWLVWTELKDTPERPAQPEAPDVYDLSGAHIERDPSLDTAAPETRFRAGFNAKEGQ